MGKKLLALMLLATPAAVHAHDQQIAKAQTVLRELHLYQGEITGTLDVETQAALRRFQMLRDLRVTGALDDATLERLRLPTSSMLAADRDFLNHTTAPPPTVAEKPPQPPPAPAPTAIPPQSIRTFLEYYLKAVSSASTAAQLTYFRNPTDYLGHKGVSQEWLRSYLEAGQRPPGRLELIDIQSVPHDVPDEALVRYEVKIIPKSRRRSARATIERYEAIIARTPTGGLKFASLQRVE